MITVYCYERCSTCKKALKWLDEKGIAYDLKDIKGEHPDEALLREAIRMSGKDTRKFFNTSGMLYRELELTKKLPDMSADEQIALLASDGMLVKRPLVLGEGFVLLGFKEAEWEAKL